jgi:hypothetical protein
MLTSTPKKNWIVFIASAPLALVHSLTFAADDNNAVVAAKSATVATTQLVNSFSTASFVGGGSLLSYRLGDITSRGQAAGDDSDFQSTSFSATPTVATINNRIEPILLDGKVSLLIMGVEKFDEIYLTAKGIAITLDRTSVTSTQRVTGVADVSSDVTGSGYTISPYYVMQLESGRLVDFNLGLGKNNLQTASAGVSAAPASDRAFLSVGTSTVTPLTKNSYVQYKATLGYTYDGVDEYTQSDGTIVNKSATKLTQVTAGLNYTLRLDSFSPFAGVTLVRNSFSTSSSAGIQPQEYSSTVLLKMGVNFSNESFYGTLSVQGERGKTSVQAYAGLRY